jgi:hypothetical protein
MGRRLNSGLRYFPLDVGIFEDKSIRRLRSKFGADGPMLYIYILCMAYRNGYYAEYTEDFAEDAAEDIGCTPEKIGLMVNYLLSKSLLDRTLFDTVKVLSSHGIQLQYQTSMKGLKRDIEVDGRLWILSKDETAGFVKVRLSENNSGENTDKSGENTDKSGIYSLKETKLNKTKLKESKSKETTPYAGGADDLFPKREIEEAYEEWLDMLRDKGAERRAGDTLDAVLEYARSAAIPATVASVLRLYTSRGQMNIGFLSAKRR